MLKEKDDDCFTHLASAPIAEAGIGTIDTSALRTCQHPVILSRESLVRQRLKLHFKFKQHHEEGSEKKGTYE